MLFGLGEDMTLIDFRFTRSKVKVTRVFFVKQTVPVLTFYHVIDLADS